MSDLERIKPPDALYMTLARPLDPERIKKREGRGRSQFSYLETHDVKRTMNTIFGFAGWGYTIVTQEEIGAVEVQKDNRDGWHVGYRCVVRLSCVGFPDTDGSGYGDAVEYGQAARVTACELAIKESESDALKRACTKLGDQLGLSLYEKDGGVAAEQRREGGLGEYPVPKTWAKVKAWYEDYGGPGAWELAEEMAKAAMYHLYGKTESKELTKDQRSILLQKAAGAVVWLAENENTPMGSVPSVAHYQQAWAHVLDGAVLEGIEWTPPEPEPPADPDSEAERLADEAIVGPEA